MRLTHVRSVELDGVVRGAHGGHGGQPEPREAAAQAAEHRGRIPNLAAVMDTSKRQKRGCTL